MMTVSKLADTLGLDVISMPDAERDVTGGYVGDLLSWVMGRATAGDAWVTIMSNVNVIAVAQLSDVACIVFAEGVEPDEAAVNAAKLHDINLLSCKKSSFEICADIARILNIPSMNGGR